MKILFIGNSYTNNNGLVAIFQELAQNKGKDLEIVKTARGGETLEGHCYHFETLSAIDQGGYDAFVMQEHSLRPVVSADRMLKFGSLLHKKFGSVKTFLYQTWARKRLPEMQKELNQAYLELSKSIGADIVPVGSVWAKVIEADADIELYVEDEAHPSILGTYISACTFYAMIFQESPIGLSNQFACEGGVSYLIDKDKADLIQRLVWDEVQDYSSH